MTRLSAIFSLIFAASLAVLAAPGVARADGPWYSEIGCEQRESCRQHDPRKAWRVQLDTSIRQVKDPATYQLRSEVRPGGELFLLFPMSKHVGITSQFRIEDSKRAHYMFVGAAFLPMSGVAIGIGAVDTTSADPHDDGGILAGSLYARHRFARFEGFAGGNADQHRLSSNATFWPLHWCGLGLMAQDDTLAPDESLIGLRFELEVKPVNAFLAFTGGLREDEVGGVLLGLRLVPWLL